MPATQMDKSKVCEPDRSNRSESILQVIGMEMTKALLRRDREKRKGEKRVAAVMDCN